MHFDFRFPPQNICTQTTGAAGAAGAKMYLDGVADGSLLRRKYNHIVKL